MPKRTPLGADGSRSGVRDERPPPDHPGSATEVRARQGAASTGRRRAGVVTVYAIQPGAPTPEPTPLDDYTANQQTTPPPPPVREDYEDAQ